jgi:hypothetical protein
MSPRTTPASPAPRAHRRRMLVAGVVAVLVLAVVAGWLALRPAGDAPRPPAAAPATTSRAPEPGTYGTSVLPSSSAAPSTVPQTVLAAVPGKPQALTPVGLDQPAHYSDGVSARLVDIKAITGAAHGVGETSGPALALVVELTNTTGRPVALDTVAVNVYTGTDGAPAARLQGDSGAPFTGSLAAGKSARAVYAFSVPENRRDLVTVTVGVTPASGTAVFSGSVA